MRGAGALGAFALHEICHASVGAAFGADIEASFRRGNLFLEFGDISQKEHQIVSIAGNACTGIAAEIIVDTGKHKKSNFAWGAAAFHSVNAFSYAFSKHGDAEYWQDSGGTGQSWQVINATHSSRIGVQLAWDSKLGDSLKERWRPGPPILPALSVASDETVSEDDDRELDLKLVFDPVVSEVGDQAFPASIDLSVDLPASPRTN